MGSMACAFDTDDRLFRTLRLNRGVEKVIGLDRESNDAGTMFSTGGDNVERETLGRYAEPAAHVELGLCCVTAQYDTGPHAEEY